MLSNIYWLMGEKIGRLAINVIIGIWIARELGQNSYGIYAYILAYLSIFTVIAGVGLNGNTISMALIAGAKSQKDEQSILRLSIYTSIIYSIWAWLASIIIGFFFLELELNIFTILLLMSITLLFKPLEVARIWLEAKEQNKELSKIIIKNAMILTILRVVVLSINPDLIVLSFIVLLEGVVVAISIFVYVDKRIGLNLNFTKLNYLDLLKYLKSGLMIILVGVGIVFHSKIDQIMLGKISTMSEVGGYAAVARIAEVLYFIPLVLMTAMSPRLVQNKYSKEYYEILESITRLLVIVSILFAVVIFFLGEKLLALLYGSGFEIDSNLIKTYVIAGPLVFMGVITNQHLIIQGKLLHAVVLSYVCGFLIIIIGLFLHKSYGVTGVAVAVVLSQLVVYFAADVIFKQTRKLFFIKLKALISFHQINESYKILKNQKNVG
jgi:O-antigen/teichoic acid export membrane protein